MGLRERFIGWLLARNDFEDRGSADPLNGEARESLARMQAGFVAVLEDSMRVPAPGEVPEIPGTHPENFFAAKLRENAERIAVEEALTKRLEAATEERVDLPSRGTQELAPGVRLRGDLPRMTPFPDVPRPGEWVERKDVDLSEFAPDTPVIDREGMHLRYTVIGVAWDCTPGRDGTPVVLYQREGDKSDTVCAMSGFAFARRFEVVGDE